MFWIVQATANESTPDGEITHQIPTFYLNGDIQGILDEDTAIQVACHIIDPCDKLDVHVSVAKA